MVCITQYVGKQMWLKSRLNYPLFVQVVVQHVNIQGLGRTKEDLLGYEISDVFHARNLIDVRTIGEVPAFSVEHFWFLTAKRCVSDVSTGDEESSRGSPAAAASGDFQRGGSSHRYVWRYGGATKPGCGLLICREALDCWCVCGLFIRIWRLAQRPGRHFWSDGDKTADRKLQHHGWQQRRQHGEESNPFNLWSRWRTLNAVSSRCWDSSCPTCWAALRNSPSSSPTGPRRRLMGCPSSSLSLDFLNASMSVTVADCHSASDSKRFGFWELLSSLPAWLSTCTRWLASSHGAP